jgi:hypothetical protein
LHEKFPSCISLALPAHFTHKKSFFRMAGIAFGLRMTKWKAFAICLSYLPTDGQVCLSSFPAPRDGAQQKSSITRRPTACWKAGKLFISLVERFESSPPCVVGQFGKLSYFGFG